MATLRSSAERIIAEAMSEDELQESVMRLGRYRGWLVYHTYRSVRSEPGFPDCVMVRRDVLLLAELKREGKDPTKPQREWLRRLKGVSEAVGGYHVQAHVWRPSDWLSGEVERVLH